MERRGWFITNRFSKRKKEIKRRRKWNKKNTIKIIFDAKKSYRSSITTKTTTTETTKTTKTKTSTTTRTK